MDGWIGSSGAGGDGPLVARARAHDVKVKVKVRVKGVSTGSGNGIGDGTVHPGQASKSPTAKQRFLSGPGPGATWHSFLDCFPGCRWSRSRGSQLFIWSSLLPDSGEHSRAEGRGRGSRPVVVPEAGMGSARIVCSRNARVSGGGVGKSGSPGQALPAQAADPQAWPDTAEAEARGARKGMRAQGDPAQHGSPGARGRRQSSSAPSPPVLALPPTISASDRSAFRLAHVPDAHRHSHGMRGLIHSGIRVAQLGSQWVPAEGEAATGDNGVCPPGPSASPPGEAITSRTRIPLENPNAPWPDH
jgi:hypothetical protein